MCVSTELTGPLSMRASSARRNCCVAACAACADCADCGSAPTMASTSRMWETTIDDGRRMTPESPADLRSGGGLPALQGSIRVVSPRRCQEVT